MESLSAILAKTYFQNTLGQYLLFFGVVILSLVLGKIFYYISKTKLRKLTSQSKSQLDDYIIDVIEEPIVLLLVSAGIWVGSQFLTLSAGGEKFFSNIVIVLLTMTIAWLLVRLFDVLVTVYVEPMVGKSESKLDDQILPILKKSIKTIVIILAAIVVLSNLGYDILSILAGLGIGGLALALAAQDAVKNIIGGITIFWDKPFQIDDWIEIDGKSGAVDEVGLRSTRIKTVGGTTVVLPNSKVADNMLENFSTRTRRRQVVNIGLTYETTADRMEEAFNIIRETIKSVDGVDNDEIRIRFVNFGNFSLDLEIVYWITDMSDWVMIIHRINMGIKRNLDDAGIDMAFPTETHYVIQSK